MIILWSIFSIIGLLILSWYIWLIVINTNIKISYLVSLWKIGFIDNILILLGVFSVIMLNNLVSDSIILFLYKIAVCLLVLLLLYKIGMSYGILPHVIIFIFSLIGLIKWGILGAIEGFILGYFIFFVLGWILLRFQNSFNIGLWGKKQRKAIANDFFFKIMRKY